MTHDRITFENGAFRVTQHSPLLIDVEHELRDHIGLVTELLHDTVQRLQQPWDDATVRLVQFRAGALAVKDFIHGDGASCDVSVLRRHALDALARAAYYTTLLEHDNEANPGVTPTLLP